MSTLFHTDSVWCMCPECEGVDERDPDRDDDDDDEPPTTPAPIGCTSEDEGI